MTKNSIVILLVGANLALIATLVLFSSPPDAAYGQTTPMGQNYVMVAGEIRDGVDALYVIDLANRRLHVFIPTRDQANRTVIYVGWRDLHKEFRGGQ